MSKRNYYVDVHVLQTLPPGCVNRDDTNTPKTARFGGKTRARMSSQSQKRACRAAFNALLADDEAGIRTKKVIELIAAEIHSEDPDADAETMAKAVFAVATGKKPEKAEKKSKKAAEADAEEAAVKKEDKGVLTFISPAQIKALAKIAMEHPDCIYDSKQDRNACHDAMTENPTLDMLLYGRMIASDDSLNIDAAVQVAHSISTHEIVNEFDYFTGMDDIAAEDHGGAAHIGTHEFNSATHYRYMNVNVRDLKEKLTAPDAAFGVKNVVEQFIRTLPDGMQNSFANRTLPAFVYVAIRDDQPVYLGDAFEAPVRAGNSGFMAPSMDAFEAFIRKTYSDSGLTPVKAFVMGRDLGDLAEKMTLPQMVERIGKEVEAYCSGKEG